MANPPAIVKLALESICLLLNESHDVPDWKTIRSTLNKDGFIPSIMNYDTLSMPYESQAMSGKINRFAELFLNFFVSFISMFILLLLHSHNSPFVKKKISRPLIVTCLFKQKMLYSLVSTDYSANVWLCLRFRIKLYVFTHPIYSH